MTPDTVNAPPGSRSARLRILLPIALLVGCLTVFLALFWHPGGQGRKGHGRGVSAAERDRSPVGGSRDEGNARVSSRGSGGRGGSPVGGGPSRSGSGSKGEVWWYQDGKQRRGAGEDAWWAPGERKSGSGAGPARGGSPVGGSRSEDERASSRRDREEAEAAEEREARESDRPARASSSNPGEVAGQKGGPDDFWWRK